MLAYSLLGFILVIAGIATILLATIKSGHGKGQHSTSVKAAGVLMIGPIPIIFGNDVRWVVVAIALAIVLVVLGLLANFW